MSREYTIDCKGHNSIYLNNYLKDNYDKRKFPVYFTTPEKGVNEDTGILLLIAGFSGHANSNVYKKMRRQFADKYNLVTVQCDYFGWEFMQNDIKTYRVENLDLQKLRVSLSKEEFNQIWSENRFNLDLLLKTPLKHKNLITIENIQNETLEYFNDMGVMQAIDNITGVLNVMSILYDNGWQFNTKKVIVMGQSHGSYIAYLSNILCRGLFTHILDNSAWTSPVYLEKNRIWKYSLKNLRIDFTFNYLAKKLNITGLNIKDLYKGFNNKCKIVCYHGENDELISVEDKYNSVKDINNVYFNTIRDNDIDMKVFKNTSHGLGADFLRLFDKFYNTYIEDEKGKVLDFENEAYLIDRYKELTIDYTNVIPIIDVNY